MVITDNGIYFDKYITARPGEYTSSFMDESGAKLTINTRTLIKMYELVKFDLEYHGVFDNVLKSIELESKNV